MAYKPDEQDKRWMKSRVNPENSFQDRMKWREEYAEKHPEKPHELKDFIIGLIVMAAVILFAFWIAGNGQ